MRGHIARCDGRLNDIARAAGLGSGIPATMTSTLEEDHRTQESNIMKSLFARFVKDQSGATAIEYGLIAGLIITAVTNLGTNAKNKFQIVADNMK